MLDNVRQFVEDPAQDELLNFGDGPGPAVSEEEVDEMIKAGLGVTGIFTAIEPADLELYRSYIYPPLSMPEKPEVAVIHVDYNFTGNPVLRYQEGWIKVKAMCPDGLEGWDEVRIALVAEGLGNIVPVAVAQGLDQAWVAERALRLGDLVFLAEILGLRMVVPCVFIFLRRAGATA